MPPGRGPHVRARLERSHPQRSLAGLAARARRISHVVAILCAMVAIAGCAAVLPKQYEYEEEVYLSLDGTATAYVNSSIPALMALRGLELDPAPRARLDRAAIRRYYTSP